MPFSNIDKPSKYFNTVLYTGNGSTQSITGVGFQPDWVWIKGRSGATDHGLYDAVRGVQKQLESNTQTAETTETTGLTAFGSDGFTVGALAQLNTSAATYVAWNWLANGAGVSNTAGSITSTVSANTIAGFSIVSWAGNQTAGASCGHGLGVVPKMIVKRRRNGDGADDWYVYTSTTGNSNSMYWTNTSASAASGAWNSQTPTSTVFYHGSSIRENGNNMIAYCFADVKGFSQFGSWTGNGNADGTFVYLGFKPEFVMLKNASGTNQWLIFDNTREPANIMGDYLEANSFASQSTFDGFDFLSNGMKMRTSNTAWNASGNTYIYMAFAKNPFVSSKGIPTTAR